MLASCRARAGSLGLPAVVLLVVLAANSRAAEIAPAYDVVVCGATPGGIARAVRAAREGLAVLVTHPYRHVGGMLVNGVLLWDTFYDGSRSPIHDEAKLAIQRHYRDTYGPDSTQYRQAMPGHELVDHLTGGYEPHVTLATFERLLAETGRVTVATEHVPVKVVREGRLIESVDVAPIGGGPVRPVRGKVFVDASYEGDPMAIAGAAHRIGREGRDEYGEPHAGKLFARKSFASAPGDAAHPRFNTSPRDAFEGRLNLRTWHMPTVEILPESTGAVAGLAAAVALRGGTTPRELDADALVAALVERRFMVAFLNDIDVASAEPFVPAVQFLATRGFFTDYDARPATPLTDAEAQDWSRRWAELSQRARTLAAGVARGDAAPEIYADLRPRELRAIRDDNGTGRVDWLEVIAKRVPPLKHDRGGRWPLILWENGPFTPQERSVYEMLLARGITQHIQMKRDHVATAKAIQAAGGPVIMMHGAGGPWPAQLAGPAETWAHRLDGGFKPQGHVKPCLSATAGWAIQADEVRATLREYRAAGVTVDGAWMDWEGDPMSGRDAFEQATHCSRCRETLPAALLATSEAFHAYRWRQYMELLGGYLAAPVREVFPRASVTNWMIVWSTPERPIRYWNDRVLAATAPAFFTAANPVAYGNTVYWKSWSKDWPVSRESVDRFYFHLLIRMVSDNEANASRWAPQADSLPWVSRYCPDDEDPTIPIMSRERYRETLRHLWLRGVDGMQVFNPVRKGFEELAVEEVIDAAAVYDEMLEHRQFLDGGRVLCLDVPGPQDPGVVWSGLVLGDRAVVRAFTQNGERGAVKVEPWPGAAVELQVPAAGRTWVLERVGDAVRGAE